MQTTITFIKPEGASIEDIVEFIDDALSSMGGCRHPEDPMFHSLKLRTIKVNGKTFISRDGAKELNQ